MRLAADPCLGFYLLPSSNHPNIPTRPALDAPPIEALHYDDSHLTDEDSSGPIVSVDAFLRRTALVRTKTYSKKSRRKDRGKRLDDLTNTIPDDMSSELETPLTKFPSRPAVSANPISKPLKKRLLRAAVLSHADPEECLLQDDPVSQSRKPLPFVEQPPWPREPIQTKRRTWSLADPRKAVPNHSNSFSSRSKAPPRSTKINTLSGWRATYGKVYLDGSTISKRKTKASKLAVPTKCLPLSFIPLHEAEECYSLMRLPHKYCLHISFRRLRP